MANKKKISRYLYRRYSNEPGSVVTHSIGGAISIASTVLLLIAGVKHGNSWHVASFAVYGFTIISMYSASSIYHLISKKNKYKQSFRIIDHATVFLLIAGTYTPLYLIALRNNGGLTMFIVTWVIAFFGIIMKILFMKRIHPWASSLFYLALGGIGLIYIDKMMVVLPSMALYWFLIGGVCYMLGMVFFGLGRLWNRRGLFGFHEIFHIFVLAGAFCHFWLMYKYVVYL